MFRVWLEWDYGQEDRVFTTREKAMELLDWVAYISHDEGWEEPFANGQAIINDGLGGIMEVTVD
jgi:hypothetical protein